MWFAAGSQADESALTLREAEQRAVARDPVLARTASLQQAFAANAVAAGTLPDPQLRLGVSNISAETFKFDQEPMTQGVVGISQAFPPAGARDAAADRFAALSDAQRQGISERRLEVLRQVRRAWLELYYQQQAKALLVQSESVFEQLSKITQYQYRAGRGNQQHVVRAQLEHSLLKDRETDIDTERERALVELERWVGPLRATPTVNFPELVPVPGRTQLEAVLEQHPALQSGEAGVRAARHGVAMEKTRYKPGWMLDVTYGVRAADRDDLFSAVVKLDLPLFTAARQGKQVEAGRAQLVAQQESLNDRRRSLRAMLDRSEALYLHISQRLQYFSSDLLPQAAQNTEAALNAYQSGVSDFGELVRARLTELDSRLKYLRLKVKRAKAHVDLLYLAGDQGA
jgi:outer membrane protein TolC